MELCTPFIAFLVSAYMSRMRNDRKPRFERVSDLKLVKSGRSHRRAPDGRFGGASRVLPSARRLGD